MPSQQAGRASEHCQHYQEVSVTNNLHNPIHITIHGGESTQNEAPAATVPLAKATQSGSTESPSPFGQLMNFLTHSRVPKPNCARLPHLSPAA